MTGTVAVIKSWPPCLRTTPEVTQREGATAQSHRCFVAVGRHALMPHALAVAFRVCCVVVVVVVVMWWPAVKHTNARWRAPLTPPVDAPHFFSTLVNGTHHGPLPFFRGWQQLHHFSRSGCFAGENDGDTRGSRAVLHRLWLLHGIVKMLCEVDFVLKSRCCRMLCLAIISRLIVNTREKQADGGIRSATSSKLSN